MKSPRCTKGRSLVRFLGPVVGFLLALASPARAATVATDAMDYAAGDIAIITGSGWEPGEVVALEIAQSPPLHAADILYTLADYTIADEAGNIYSGYVVPGHDVAQTFTLTATASISGASATTTFTNGVDFTSLPAPTADDAADAMVATDRSEYFPRQTAIVTGSGWEPGETVALEIVEDPLAHPAEVLHAIADGAGNIVAGYFIDDHDLGQSFALTATGQSSGRTAQTAFTDDVVECDTDADCDGGCATCNTDSATPHCTGPNKPAGTACASDDNPCTDDVCGSGNTNGKCTHPNDNANTCTDNNACTDDACVSGSCVGTNDDTNACSDGDACTSSDHCSAGACTGTTVTCNDNNPCTDDSCDPTSGCTYTNDDTNTCSDGNACTSSDHCSAGACGGTTVTCNDNNECTDDSCDPASGCVYTNDDTNTCSDDDACTDDHCSAGTCATTAIVCDDNNPCTDDTCSSASGCVYTNNTAPCDDDTVCNGHEVCADGTCNPGTQLDCDDQVDCTDDSCDPETGCVNTPDDTACDDNNGCTDDVCNPTAGCEHRLNDACVGSITNSSLCTFDVDGHTDGSQFRLIYTPDQGTSYWKLNASNPGQFYYDAFHLGAAAQVEITLPYPFVTQGAVPIHVYGSATPTEKDGETCFVPGTEIAHDSTQVTLESYSPKAFGSTTTVTVNVPAGFAYVAIHLDYGLKGTVGYAKGMGSCTSSTSDAVEGGTSNIVVADCQSYVFSDDVGGSATTSSENAFKRDPGIGGLVLKANGDPVPNVTAKIYDSSSKLVATVSTDADGWYMWQYKYTGKASTFTVKLPDYGQAKSVTLKSNAFVVVSFTVP